MLQQIQVERLSYLLLIGNHLPAGQRLITWGIACLTRDHWDNCTLQTILELPPDQQWDAIRAKLIDKDLHSLLKKLELESSEIATTLALKRGLRVGDRVSYIGNHHLLTKLIRSVPLEILSFQHADHDVWMTCKPPHGLEQTFQLNFAKKLSN